MKAIWNGEVLAESDKTIFVEGNHYFPPNSIHNSYFEKSSYSTSCPWKGSASYYSLNVKGKMNKDAAWYYPETKPAADQFQNYIAFWKGVEITK